MSKLTRIARRVPFLSNAIRMLDAAYARFQLKGKDTEQVFTDIFRDNAWGGTDSASGTGSDTDQTRIISHALPALFKELQIKTMLDIPCGDFHWMKNVDLSGMSYTGADIVEPLIKQNAERYGKEGVRFERLNLMQDPLPNVNLVFCRDCLVHLSFADILKALKNVCDSQSQYLLATTFTDRKRNVEIPTGRWRVLNMEIAPILLPKPIKLINEGCTERNGDYKDKALGLWSITGIRERLARRGT